MKKIFYLVLSISGLCFSPLSQSISRPLNSVLIKYSTILNSRSLIIKCNDEINFRIYGRITDINIKPLKGIKVNLLLNGSIIKEIITGSNGEYEFTDLIEGTKYKVVPVSEKKDYDLNGVTAADIVFIINHILGRTLLYNPYLFVAADVNKSGSITSADISAIRKMILGLSTNFLRDIWSYIPTSLVVTNPWQIETYSIEQEVDESLVGKSIDFVGVKTGDMNVSYK